jgi:type VI secretion system secreted protein VgrG
MHIDPRIHDLREALSAERPLPRVHYELVCEAVPDLLWRVRHVALDEGLSEPYELVVDLLLDEAAPDPESLLATSCELLIDRDGLTRSVCGVVMRVELHDPLEDQQPLRLVVVPALRLLEQRVDTRLWQGMSALAIVEEVLGAALSDYGREVDTSHLQGSYTAREYVVQYHESDLDFVSRLLEDEGIAYRFDHDHGTGREVMVLEDGADHWPEIVTLDDEPSLAIISTRAHEAELESLQSLSWSGTVRPTAVVRRTVDWRHPTKPTTARVGAAEHELPARELYHHGGLPEQEPQARVVRELDHAQAGARRVRGVSNAIGLEPGRRFRVVGEDRPELQHELLVVRRHMRGDCPDAQLGKRTGELDYRAEVECVVSTGEPWRPPLRAPVPKIHGPQTAVVTGPEPEEIHTDGHGRVKVRFEWDRQHGPSDDTSMWIRVAQGWAGNGFGMLFLPRVGTEVVVEFIGGDPDRPLVTGCVYNPESAASIPLPDAKTQSTIRTRSSPGGDGHNELRFEDAAGAEQILLHAQRDLLEEIGRDHTIRIANARTETVGGKHRQTVRGDQHLVVEKNRSEHIHGDEDVTHEHSRTTRVYGEEFLEVYDHTLTVHHGSAERRVLGWDETTVSVNGDGIAKSRTRVEGELEFEVKREAKLSAGDRVNFVQGPRLGAEQARISLADASIEQNAEQRWKAHAGTCAELHAGSCLKLSGDERAELRQGRASIEIQNDVVVIEARELRFVVGDNELVISESGLSSQSKAVDLSALGAITLKGASVSLD